MTHSLESIFVLYTCAWFTLHILTCTAHSLYRVINWINDYLLLKIIREKGISFLFKIREKGQILKLRNIHAIHMLL